MSTVMPPILGGRWDLSDPNTPAGGYWQALYQLRNDVIHSAAIVKNGSTMPPIERITH
jgi:hypothetical protein